MNSIDVVAHPLLLHPENVTLAQQLIESDPRVTIDQLTQAIQIRNAAVNPILHDQGAFGQQ